MPRQPGQAEADLALMRRVATAEEAAISDLYERFGSLVYRMAYQAMPTRAEAEDGVQEIFVRLWQTADRYDPKRAALVTWVMLISRRHLVDRLRRNQVRLRAAPIDENRAQPAMADDRLMSRMERDEKYKALLVKIKTLPDLQRTVVIRAYLGGQTLRQIGEELDTPLGTIKSALSRALVRLRERTNEELSA